MTDEDKEPIPSDPLQLVPMAFERATYILKLRDEGMLQGDIPQEAGLLLAQGVVTMAGVIDADSRALAKLEKRVDSLRLELASALAKAGGAQDERLPPNWYWSTKAPAEARSVGGPSICRHSKGRPHEVGIIPYEVRRAASARWERVAAEQRRASTPGG